jgi:hypothetical protein
MVLKKGDVTAWIAQVFAMDKALLQMCQTDSRKRLFVWLSHGL